MVARAVVLPPDGLGALRRRLAVLSARGPVLVVVCRGPMGSFDDLVELGVDLENVMVFDARGTLDPDDIPTLDPSLVAFGPRGIATAQDPWPGFATILVDDLPTLLSSPDPHGLLGLVRQVRDVLFPHGADIEYVTAPGAVPPQTWDVVAETVDEVLPLLETGRLERIGRDPYGA